MIAKVRRTVVAEMPRCRPSFGALLPSSLPAWFFTEVAGEPGLALLGVMGVGARGLAHARRPGAVAAASAEAKAVTDRWSDHRAAGRDILRRQQSGRMAVSGPLRSIIRRVPQSGQ
jgi:hypothetical protein